MLLRTVAITAIVAATVVVAAERHASGTWKIDVSKTEWAPSPHPPDDMVWKIKEDSTNLWIEATYSSPNGDKIVEKFRFDMTGKETVNANAGVEVRTVMREEGDELIEQSTGKMPDGTVLKRTSRSRISEDGRTLTQHVEITLPQGSFKRKIVMNKQ